MSSFSQALINALPLLRPMKTARIHGQIAPTRAALRSGGVASAKLAAHASRDLQRVPSCAIASRSSRRTASASPSTTTELARAIGHACRKRDIGCRQIDGLVSGFRRKSRPSATRCPRPGSSKAMMAGLNWLDHVAYIAFHNICSSAAATTQRSSAEQIEGRRPASSRSYCQ